VPKKSARVPRRRGDFTVIIPRSGSATPLTCPGKNPGARRLKAATVGAMNTFTGWSPKGSRGANASAASRPSNQRMVRAGIRMPDRIARFE
jgi:hypothetical protein